MSKRADGSDAGSGRTRNFVTIVYPESAPINWQNILREMCIPAFISPLHDQDVNPDGEPKKPHYHVIVMFDSVKSVDQVRKVFDQIGGVGCVKINSLRGQARYLCHLDNPEKAPYDKSEVIECSGADYWETINLITDRYAAIREMIAFCEENQVSSYADLLIWCMENKFEWFRVLCDNGTYVIKEYLKSRTWSTKSCKLPGGKTEE